MTRPWTNCLYTAHTSPHTSRTPAPAFPLPNSHQNLPRSLWESLSDAPVDKLPLQSTHLTPHVPQTRSSFPTPQLHSESPPQCVGELAVKRPRTACLCVLHAHLASPLTTLLPPCPSLSDRHSSYPTPPVALRAVSTGHTAHLPALIRPPAAAPPTRSPLTSQARPYRADDLSHPSARHVPRVGCAPHSHQHRRVR